MQAKDSAILALSKQLDAMRARLHATEAPPPADALNPMPGSGGRAE